MYTKFLITILTVLSFMTVAYCKFAEPQTIEPFNNYPMIAREQTVACCDNGNCVDANSVMNVPSDANPPVASTTVVEPYGCSANAQQAASSVAANAANGAAGREGFFTVPGTMQATPPPRFANESYGANIMYGVPDVKHLAADPSNPFGSDADPMSLANNVETFEQQDRENYEHVQTQFAQKHEQLPLPATMHHSSDAGAAGGSGAASGCNKYTLYSRLIYSTPRSNQRSTPCPVRGDLPIDHESPCWFKSRYSNHGSSNHSVGAMGHLTGNLSDKQIKHAKANGQVPKVEEHTGVSRMA